MTTRGITTLEDLRQRCIVTEDGHWLWSLSTVSAQHASPACSISKFCDALPDLAGKRIAARHAVARFTGRTLRSGWVAYGACQHRLCIAPRCVRTGPRGKAIAHSASAGHFQAARKRAAMQASSMQRRKLNTAQVQDILHSTDSNTAAGRRHNVSREVVRRIRAGQSYLDALPAASVFGLARAITLGSLTP